MIEFAGTTVIHGLKKDFDVSLLPLCNALNSLPGITTEFCCSGNHRDGSGGLYITLRASDVIKGTIHHDAPIGAQDGMRFIARALEEANITKPNNECWHCMLWRSGLSDISGRNERFVRYSLEMVPERLTGSLAVKRAKDLLNAMTAIINNIDDSIWRFYTPRWVDGFKITGKLEAK